MSTNVTSPIWLDAKAVASSLEGIDCVAAMRDLFRAHGDNQATQPPQVLTLLPDGMGDFITYSGVLQGEGVFGVKVSPYIVRPQGGTVTATTLLLSLETGLPLLMCDSLALTTERTAATTALAVDLLARPDASKLTIIGSGPIAMAHLRHTLPVRAWKRVRIHSPNIGTKRADLLRLFETFDAKIEIVESHREALTDADVVMLCTSSGSPVIAADKISPGMLVTSISTNVAQAHEIPPEMLTQMNVYCDDGATTPKIAGEMVLASKSGWTSEAILGDLGSLATGRARKADPTKASFFRSMGLGIEDVKMALELYRRTQP